MAKKLAFSNEELPLSELYKYKVDAHFGLNLLFANPYYQEELLLLTDSEIKELLATRVDELDRQASLVS